jgi:phage baseplate assembly protein W
MAAETIIWSDLHPDLKKTARAEIKLVTNVEAVYASLENIFLTMEGERVMLRNFGGNFKKLLFEPLLPDVLRDNYMREMKETIEAWEPRVILHTLDMTANQDRDTLHVRMDLYIRGYDKIFTYDKTFRIGVENVAT